ncbi:MAG: hypothetical protein ACRDHD_02325 [Candidatus Limnocylindria bacterium]
MPIDRIVGTVRHPTQNTTDFLPLPEQRGRNWEARWQRILQATDDLSILPAIDLVQVGDEYYVADGHNRVAAALSVGAVAIDADVTELVMPGEAAAHTDAPPSSATSILLGADEVRQAAAGRQSRTVEQRSRIDELRRDELTGHPEVEAAEPSDQADE